MEQSAALGIKPRAGIHTGECDIVDGQPGGLALRTAAWMMAESRAGEILASQTVRDLVSGSAITFADSDIRAAAPGPGGTWRLFRVESPYRVRDTAPTPALQVPAWARHPLTPREREVVGLLARGRTNGEIADTVVISERTVENHASNVLGKLALDTRAQVAVWALRHDQATA